jgi:hypothetical protein
MHDQTNAPSFAFPTKSEGCMHFLGRSSVRTSMVTHGTTAPINRAHARARPAPLLNIAYVSVLIILIFLIGENIVQLPQYIRSDSENIQAMVTAQAWNSLNEQESHAYLRAAMFFDLFQPISPTTVALAIASLYVFSMYYKVRDPFCGAIIALIAAPSIVLSMPFPQKDTISNLAATLVVWTLVLTNRNGVRLWIIAIVYVLVAFYIRPYYAGIALLFVGMVAIQKRIPEINVLILGGTCIILVLASVGMLGEKYLEPQQHRDFVNLHRILASGEGNRTAFNNVVPPNSFVNFVVNYVFAALYLNLPIVFLPDAKSAAMTLYMSGVMGCCIYGAVWAKSRHANLASYLVLSHLLVLWTFEPDLGSYLRHVSITTIYIAVIIRESFAAK